MLAFRMLKKKYQEKREILKARANKEVARKQVAAEDARIQKAERMKAEIAQMKERERYRQLERQHRQMKYAPVTNFLKAVKRRTTKSKGSEQGRSVHESLFGKPGEAHERLYGSSDKRTAAEKLFGK